MKEIKKGEYVRTDNGEIHKVEDIEDLRIHIKTEKIMFRSWVDDYYGAHKEDRFIVKHSQNIIDLIEVGDYVNGYKVLDIMEDMETGEIHLEMTSDYTNEIIGDCTIYNDDIKTIVTHEQMSNIEYRLED